MPSFVCACVCVCDAFEIFRTKDLPSKDEGDLKQSDEFPGWVVGVEGGKKREPVQRGMGKLRSRWITSADL